MPRHLRSRIRGTTLLEVLVAVGLLLIIFLFITADLLQSSEAENVAATRSETLSAANYLLAVIRTDPNFWGSVGNDWATGPGGTDPCGNAWPAYSDTWASQSWHPAPACTPNGSSNGLFPDLVNVPSFQYMWNVQQQGANIAQAQITVWVKVDEGGRLNVYEVHGTRANVYPQASNTIIVPTVPPTGPSPCVTGCVSPSPTATATPKPSPSPTKKPSPTPKPSPIPSGTFE